MIHAVAGMVDVRKLSRLWRAHRGEVALAVGPLLGVLLIGILPGVVIGVAASFVLLIHRLGHPHVALLGRSPGGVVYRDLARHPDVEAVPGVLVYRFEAPLVFANAEVFSDGVIGAIEAADPPPRAVVLDFSAVPDVDSTGGHAVLGLIRALQRRGITIVLARAHATVRRSLHRDGVMAALGRDHVVATVRDAVALVESPDATTVPHDR